MPYAGIWAKQNLVQVSSILLSIYNGGGKACCLCVVVFRWRALASGGAVGRVAGKTVGGAAQPITLLGASQRTMSTEGFCMFFFWHFCNIHLYLALFLLHFLFMLDAATRSCRRCGACSPPFA